MATKMSATAARSTYSVPEAAARLGISVARTRQLVSSGKLASTKSGPRRYVPAGAIAEYEAAALARREALLAAAPTDWEWEGNLVNTLARWFRGQGWQEVSRANAALREHGIDLVVTKDDRTRVIEVKSWPVPNHATGAKAGHKKRWRARGRPSWTMTRPSGSKRSSAASQSCSSSE